MENNGYPLSFTENLWPIQLSSEVPGGPQANQQQVQVLLAQDPPKTTVLLNEALTSTKESHTENMIVYPESDISRIIWDI